MKWWREIPEDGYLEKGYFYRFPISRRPPPEPEIKPEVLEVIRRAQARLIREHLEKRNRLS